MRDKIMRDISRGIQEIIDSGVGSTRRDPFVFEDLTFLSQHSFPQAVTDRGRIFIGGSGIFSQKVCEYDMKTGQKYEVDLEYAPGDDHNAVCIGFTNDLNNIIVGYVDHNEHKEVKYRKGSGSTLDTLGEEQTLETSGDVGYLHLFTYENMVYIITRQSIRQWAVFYSEDNGDTWSEQITLTDMDDANTAQTRYINTGKRRMQDANIGFVLHGHNNSIDNAHYFAMDLSTGDITTADGTYIANVQSGDGLPLDRTDGDLIYDGEANDTPTQIQTVIPANTSNVSGYPPLVAYITFPNYDSNDGEDMSLADYKLAYFDTSANEFVTVMVKANVTSQLGLLGSHPHLQSGFTLCGPNMHMSQLEMGVTFWNEETEKWEAWHYFGRDLDAITSEEQWSKEKVYESDLKLMRPIQLYDHTFHDKTNVPFFFLEGYLNVYNLFYYTNARNPYTRLLN